LIKALVLTKYGDLAASTRQRFSLYEKVLNKSGIHLEYLPLLSNNYVKSISSGGKIYYTEILISYCKRLGAILKSNKYDIIWVHCELFPYIPGIFERVINIHKRPIFYDYDDAIFHMYDKSRSRAIRFFLARKLEPLMKSAAACLCGNEYLQRYASAFCKKSYIVPTVVDTDKLIPMTKADRENLTIGWIGTPSTWKYVEPLLPELKRLSSDRVHISVIGSGQGQSNGFDFKDWSYDKEVSDLQEMDIGIMPLPDEPWAKGKCGYKIIQYMACGKAVVASPVGVNAKIVKDGFTGLLANNSEDWRIALERLISSRELRLELGTHGRAHVVNDYSLNRWGPEVVHILSGL